jgi:hypothetical protein
MTEATQTVTPQEAREASKSRVTTQETILSKLTTPEATKAPEQSEGEKGKDGEHKPKKSAAERIQELAGKRREAEARADAAEREAAALRARVDSLSTQAKPLEASAKPLRSQYATDDDYIESLTDWKAREAIAKRELESAKARDEADEAETVRVWSQRQEAVMKVLPDYAEVIGKSEVAVPAAVHYAVLESPQGPQIAYYLALHPEEARKISQMKPIAAIKRIASLERDMAEIEADEVATGKAKEPDDKGEEQSTVKKSKAPPPFEAIRSVPSSAASTTSDFDEYKRRRQAEKRK